ncbi:MAG: DUF1365 domain-containing protein [Planctomycetes bacterium]|nr:DUF1365 domain-containing protein [Planctomycetota bacterium]
MESALYRGWVRHRRRSPRPHAFRRRLTLLYLDLDELEHVFAGRLLWSVERRNVVSFRRADFLGDPSRPLADEVRAVVAAETGRAPSGPVRLLTHLRTLGVSFHPVSFYYCFEPDGRTLAAVVAEITNTPWGERHRYVLARTPGERTSALHRRFAKAFHVSPFMPMQQDYDWTVGTPGDELFVHMENLEADESVFDATLRLEREPLTGRSLAGCLLRHPWAAAEVLLAIYVHAALLWIKRTPFFTHPSKAARVDDESPAVRAPSRDAGAPR